MPRTNGGPIRAVGQFTGLLLAVGGLALWGAGTQAVAAASPVAAAAVQIKSSPAQLARDGSVNLQTIANRETSSSSTPVILKSPVAINRQSPNRSETTSGTAPATSSVSLASGRATTPSAVGANATPTPTSFPGLTGAQQAAANGAYDLEPPDQGLCANNSYVIEPINNAMAIYRTNGQLALPAIPLSSVFGVPAESTGFSTSDPRCYYDSQTQRWFLTELAINGSTSDQLLAVSQTPDPLGSYTDFYFNTTSSGDGCPCFGDYPMIGADANGFYITTNEFSIATSAFYGAQLYAMSKVELELAADGAPVPALVLLTNLPDAFDPAHPYDTSTYHLSPALSPPTVLGMRAPNNGTELFTMSDPIDVGSTAVAVYALENTASLVSETPSLALAYTLVGTQAYQFPALGMAVRQAPAPVVDTPLRAYLDRHNLGSPQPVPEGVLQADFDAVQQTTWADGTLYTELSSASSATKAVGTTSAEWFQFTPGFTVSGALYASVANQGNIVGGTGVSLLYPALAVNAQGTGEMVVTYTGGLQFPSMVTIPVSATGPDASSATLVAAGAAPEDGFTCYDYYVGPSYGGCRWGDYSFAVVAPDGLVWTATEWIPPSSYRDFYTNWGTYIASNATEVSTTKPAVTGIEPTSGTTAGGTDVTISGSGFTGATAVDFGSTAAASFTVIGDSSIAAVSPSGTGTVDVTVTTAAGTSTTSPADQFTYTSSAPTLAVTGISPNTGSPFGSTTVTISGAGFTLVTAVDFGSRAAVSFIVNSASSITAVSPAGSGTVNVTVTANGVTSATSAADYFTYEFSTLYRP